MLVSPEILSRVLEILYTVFLLNYPFTEHVFDTGQREMKASS